MFDCQKRKLEACMHAAQNERLPLRAVVQVLFFEQLQLRHAIAGTLVEAEEPLRPSVLMVEEENETEQFQFQNVDLWLAPAFSSIVNR